MSDLIFQITGVIDMTEVSESVTACKAAYDTYPDFHISLKNKTYLERGSQDELYTTIQSIAKTASPIHVSFSEPFSEQTSHGMCIMLRAEQNPLVVSLQKTLCNPAALLENTYLRNTHGTNNNLIPISRLHGD